MATNRVDDHGLEVIAKAAGIAGSPTEPLYFLLTKILGSVTGSFSPSGLSVELKTTCVDITDVATAIPLTPLTARNSISIVNLSDADILYLGKNASVTADRALGNNSGWEVNPNEGFQTDITDAIILYAIAPAGKTIRVKILELA